MPTPSNPKPARRAQRERGDTVILGEILLFASVVALGIALWGLSLGYVTSHSTSLTKDFDSMISQQRSFLIIEATSLQTNIVWVSNHGLNDIAVISCTIYPKSQHSPGIRHNIAGVKIPANTYDLAPLRRCERFPGPPPYIVEVWYVPHHLYDSEEPAKNSMWALVARYEAR
ncbi:MAG: hypothetical protein QXW60_06350 [Nitrososphaerota archaeon]